LLKKRGELIERSFAHCYETGRMRRVYLRGRENVLKRQLIHVGAFNLSLIFRQKLGAGTPRELRNRGERLIFVYLSFWVALETFQRPMALLPRLFHQHAEEITRPRSRTADAEFRGV
jgi:hypothetical protein